MLVFYLVLGCPAAFKNEALGGSPTEALGGFSKETPRVAVKRIHWMAFEKDALPAFKNFKKEAMGLLKKRLGGPLNTRPWEVYERNTVEGF